MTLNFVKDGKAQTVTIDGNNVVPDPSVRHLTYGQGF